MHSEAAIGAYTADSHAVWRVCEGIFVQGGSLKFLANVPGAADGDNGGGGGAT